MAQCVNGWIAWSVVHEKHIICGCGKVWVRMEGQTKADKDFIAYEISLNFNAYTSESFLDNLQHYNYREAE